MTTIKLKRVYEKKNADDGFRVLVDRLWPRGVSKEDLPFELWPKEITPSPELRKWFHENPEEHWAEFRKKYRHELERNDAVTDFLVTIKKQKSVTLLYASRDPEHNHAMILKEFLESRL